jgi:hypothetical protein
MVGLYSAYRVLYAVLVDVCDIAGPVVWEVLGAEDILQFFSKTAMEGSTFCSSIQFGIGDAGLEVCVIGDEVMIALP